MMDAARRKQLEAAGWRGGDAAEFLGLTPEDLTWIEMHEALTRAVVVARRAAGLTQAALARHLESSQSRIAKLEAGDPGVSFDLMIRVLIALGRTAPEIGRVIAGGRTVVTRRSSAASSAPKRAGRAARR